MLLNILSNTTRLKYFIFNMSIFYSIYVLIYLLNQYYSLTFCFITLDYVI